MPFVEVVIYGRRDYPVSAISKLPEELLKAATTLERVLSWNYLVQYHNPRNAVIAGRWWTTDSEQPEAVGNCGLKGL